MKKNTILIIILAALLLAAIAYIGVTKYQETKMIEQYNLVSAGYSKGVNDCVNQTVQAIINDLKTNGFTEVRFQENNETKKVILVPYVPQQNESSTQ